MSAVQILPSGATWAFAVVRIVTGRGVTLQPALMISSSPLGLDWETFCDKGLYAPPPQYLKFEQEHNGQPLGFATFSGKIELFSELLQELGADPLPVHKPMARQNEKFPLLMVSGGRKQPYWASSYRQLPSLKKKPSRPEAEVCQQTAVELGLTEGQLIWVETERGRARFHLKFIDMRPGVCQCGLWLVVSRAEFKR